MEFQLLKPVFASTAGLVALFLFLYSLIRWRKPSSTKKYPPQPSGSWPVIGHLHLLGDLPHISLGKLADKYGSLFMIKLGVHRALVVSSPAMAKECLGTNDKKFLDRPQSLFVEHMAYNSAIFAFSRYNQYWRDMRKVSIVELLSNNRVEMFRHVRISEIRSAIKDIYDSHCVHMNGQLVDIKRWFNDISMNSIVRSIAGKSLKQFYQGAEYHQIAEALRNFFELAGAFVPADALPILRLFDIGGHEKAMKKVAKEIDHVAQGWLDGHRRRASVEGRSKQDFMDAMLGIYETGQESPNKYGTDTTIKATCMSMILAGTDTTAVTLIWALSLLLNNREAMKKAQAEIDVYVGKERQVNESDLKNLTYLEAVIKETMRLYPAGPLSVPRETTEDCTVNGYHIRAGTRLFVNLYKIHRDPNIWPNPLEFHPERFLTTHKDFDPSGQNFAYIPFGSGRRICPGISYALQFMQFALASLLQAFEISTPSDNQTVDMTEGFGLSNMKATPLEVTVIPRLPDQLYDPYFLTS